MIAHPFKELRVFSRHEEMNRQKETFPCALAKLVIPRLD